MNIFLVLFNLSLIAIFALDSQELLNRLTGPNSASLNTISTRQALR